MVAAVAKLAEAVALGTREAHNPHKEGGKFGRKDGAEGSEGKEGDGEREGRRERDKIRE